MLCEDIGEGLCPGSGLCLSRLARLPARVRGEAELTRPDRTGVRSGGSCSLCLLCRYSALLQIAGLRLSDLCRNVERQKNNKFIPENHGKHSSFSLYILFIFCYLMNMNMVHIGKDVLYMPPRQRWPPAIPPDSVYIPRRIIPLKDETALSVFGLDAHSILHSKPARKVTFLEQVVIDGWED